MKKICFILWNACAVLQAGSLLPELKNAQEVGHFLLLEEQTIEKKAEETLQGFQEGFTSLFTQKENTFANTIQKLDLLIGQVQSVLSFYEGMGLVQPDPKIRSSCDLAQNRVRTGFLEVFLQRPELYSMVEQILEKEDLLEEDRYYAEDLLQQLRLQGLYLSEKEQREITSLQSEIADLGLLFQKNIQEDQQSLFVKKEELEGLEEHFINQLSKIEDEQYELTCSYPTYFSVLKFCKNSKTRKDLQHLFVNRAYPANTLILQAMIEKRDKLAKLLGYESYADLELHLQMAKTVSHTQVFLQDLLCQSKDKANREFHQMTKNLPNGVCLTQEGKLCSYDVPFVIEHYRQKEFFLDERQISEYFPLEKVLQGLIYVYGTFFNLDIEEVHKVPLWDPDVRLFAIKNHGYILLDPFPRENKYAHACECTLLPAYSFNEVNCQALSLIVTNFPKASSSRPALLSHGEVRTLFHEFGHALHDILGRGRFLTKTGTRVKRDFVELPSQLLEEWLWDPQILQNISSHYLTGAPLPDSLIASMRRAKNSTAGLELQKQCLLSLFSLACFDANTKEDPSCKLRKLQSMIQQNYAYSDGEHFPCSFGHLDGYGASYYGYIWAKVLALDVFAKIQERGILNPEIGQLYIKKILAPGGTKDPNQMVLDFLQREPSVYYFIQTLE